MSNTKILVVEDEGIIARDIQFTLEGLGYEVPGLATLGEEAVEKTGELHPDLVLMDIMLGGEIDGVAAADQIRQRFQTPVVYLTAHSDTATLQRAKLTDPYGYVVKPLVERDLHMAIEMALNKHRFSRQLANRERWLSTTLASLGEAVVVTGTDGTIQFVNHLAEAITGWKRADVLGQPLDQALVLTDETETVRDEGIFFQVMRKGLVLDWSGEMCLHPRNGPITPIDYTAAPIRYEDGEFAGIVLVFRDVTPRRQTEEDLERVNRELQSTLEKIQTIKGIVPICANCKKIRTDGGHWEQVELFVAKNTLAKFSHSMCPDCVELYYGDIYHRFPESSANG